MSINSNFLIIENEINNLEDTFNINTVTGAMDISEAVSGQIKAKDVYFNTLTLPVAGSPGIILYGTGASAGNASFSGNVSVNTLNVGSTGSFNSLSATGPASFSGSSSFSGTVISYERFTNGATGIFVENNRKFFDNSNTMLPVPSSGGGGATGSYSLPYVLSGQESTVYADCSYVSGIGADSANQTGFFFQAGTGDGSVLNSLPAGYRLTIINTSSDAGVIATGVTGPGGTQYYTGLNTVYGQYSGTGITIPSGKPYKVAVTLQWEPRIGLTYATQKGSWAVISSSLITNF